MFFKHSEDSQIETKPASTRLYSVLVLMLYFLLFKENLSVLKLQGSNTTFQTGTRIQLILYVMPKHWATF